MRRNDQSNRLIQWIIIIGDFILLNGILLGFSQWHWRMGTWGDGMIKVFILVNNIALMLSQLRFSTIVHLRLVGGGDILKRIVALTVMQSVLAYLLTLIFAYYLPLGWIQYEVGTLFFFLLLLKRLSERWFIKLYREAGRNIRSVTLVGSDPELVGIFKKLKDDDTLGYRMMGYYGDEHLQKLIDEIDEMEKNKKREPVRLKRLGSCEAFLDAIKNEEELDLGDELYYCV